MSPQQVENQTWHAVLAALEANNVADAQIKGHSVVRHFPEQEEDSSNGGHFAISPKPSVSMFYKYPAPSVGILFACVGLAGNSNVLLACVLTCVSGLFEI